MICKLCNLNEADKKNTHYLSDNIIRLCLNEDGLNIREKGFMFDVSSNTPFIDFSFQRETSQSSIEEALGREPTDDEILKAKQIAYSVDYEFCKKCEAIFTAIEEEFTKTILPKLRGNDLTGIHEMKFQEMIIIRKFFLLQVWRTSVCDNTFVIPKSLQDNLKAILLNEHGAEQKLLSIPLNITYLNTLGDDFEYTKNLVGIGMIDGNAVIFFNDFIIQVFESEKSIKYIDIFGVNQEDSFRYFTNCNEEIFVVKIIDNQSRVEITNNYFNQEKVDKQLRFYRHVFEKQYEANYGYFPSEQLISKFVYGIIYGSDCTPDTRYTIDRFLKYGNEFFRRMNNYR